MHIKELAGYLKAHKRAILPTVYQYELSMDFQPGDVELKSARDRAAAL